MLNYRVLPNTSHKQTYISLLRVTKNEKEGLIIMPIKIEYYRKDTYGQTRYYIKQPREAHYIQQLLGKQTITKENMSTFSKLFPVKFVQVLAPEEETPL